MELGDIGEFGWIRFLRERFPSDKSIGIGDDCAYILRSGSSLITCDLLVEGVHFERGYCSAISLGRKALAVNISDISAMGGVPRYALLGVGFPKNLKLSWAKQFIVGFEELAEKYKIKLIGGDTVRSKVIAISVTLLGEMEKGKPILRSGAVAGDRIYVTGTLGDSALGLELLKKATKNNSRLKMHRLFPVMKHLEPEPRVEVGKRLVGIAHSMIDISDGLIWDIGHILEESGKKGGLRAILELEEIPVSRAFQSYFAEKHFELERARRLILSGGEDYELLFSADKKDEKKILKISEETGVQIKRIGWIEPARKTELVVLDKRGNRIAIKKPSFEHFPAKKMKKNKKWTQGFF